jgi:hypothetical protein
MHDRGGFVILNPTHLRICFTLVAGLTLATILSACSRNSPTAPSSAVLGGPASVERRVGTVGGGEGQCPEEEGDESLCASFWGIFALIAPNGDRLTGAYETSADNWLVTGGTGRFEAASGYAEFAAGQGYVTTRFNFETAGPSPAVLAEGTLTLSSSHQRSSTECISGLAVDEVHVGTLESFGRVTLEWSRCVLP